jgi:hypothetical protein
MDDSRIDSLSFDDSLHGQTQDGSKKRSKQGRIESQEELTDQVVLSSGGDTEEEPLGYFPNSSDAEPK